MRKLTKEQFIENAINIHGDKFDYYKSVYKNNYTKIEIYCKTCKNFFWQTPINHLNTTCKICSLKKRSLNLLKNTKWFINKANGIHEIGRYDYNKVIYVDCISKVIIHCNICKKYFKQIPSDHLSGKGCMRCGIIERSKKHIKTKEQFIENAINIHGDKYGYDIVKYITSIIKVKIYCKKHKNFYWQIPSSHLQGQGCPICCESKGEKEIRKSLDKYNIIYTSQKRFNNCIDKRTLPFDFYLSELGTCIEYQGRQHYELVDFSGYMKIAKMEENLKNQQRKDKIKKEYCLKNTINLLEIPYWDFKNIEKIISNINTYKGELE